MFMSLNQYCHVFKNYKLDPPITGMFNLNSAAICLSMKVSSDDKSITLQDASL